MSETSVRVQSLIEQAQGLIEWIHAAQTFGEKHGLENMRHMLALLGNPERRFKSVHIAGTNGKGSVCAFTERALREAGLRTGLYTSPYLVRYQERFRLDGQPVSDDLLIRMGARVREAAKRLEPEGIRPTVFELGTALAFSIFAERQVDIAVIEVGLGGRLDPTNVLSPEACAIANIGLDHMQVLGDTIEQIAQEKAGIIKPGVPVALYPARPGVLEVVRRAAAERNAPLMDTERIQIDMLLSHARGASFRAELPQFGPMDVEINMAGEHQVHNALLALCLLSLLNERGFALDKQKLLRGIRLAEWPGRLSWLSDRLLLDGAHNEQGAQALCDYARRFLHGKKVVLLTAMMKDKRPEACAALLGGVASAVVVTQVNLPRALDANDLAALYRTQGTPTIVQPDAKKALLEANLLAGPDGLVLVCGSLYLVGEVMGMRERGELSQL